VSSNFSRRKSYASFVGVSASEGTEVPVSDRWSACVARSGSRVPDAAKLSSRAPLLVAFRGDDGGFFEDDCHTVMCDGAIENLRQLAISLNGIANPAMASDAALIAGLFARFGETIFERFIGSFALAVFVRANREVVLARDRFGDRPLFYGRTRAGWAWASEIKSLCPLLERVALDSEGLRQAIHYRYVLGDTLIDGVSQVMPSSVVRLDASGRAPEKQYWKLDLQPSEEGSMHLWADRVESGLDACFARLRGRYRDVGILLSGGVDSSILALKAATLGFRNCVALTPRWPGENPELEAAAAVARHVGIEHRVVDIEESEIDEMFPWIVWRLEEPPRHYNSFVLAKLFAAASGRFDTLLSGHAADVLFGPPGMIGLDRFRRRLSRLALLPQLLKDWLAAVLRHSERQRVIRWRKYLEIDEHQFTQRYFKIHYPGRWSQFGPPDPSRRSIERFYDPLENAPERFQRFDLYTFNQSHTQVYDRLGAPLDVSVTTPFLAPEVVDVAARLPSGLKADGQVAKPVLKTLAARYFPTEWIYRPNQGFPTPTQSWLKGPLAGWQGVLFDKRMATRDVFDIASDGKLDVDRDFEAVWTAMTLEMFHRQFLDGDGGPSTAS